jgi:predicted DNA-binding transcriptional regulator AlpA
MEGVSIVETRILERLISRIEALEAIVLSNVEELKQNKKPYLSTQELMELTGFGKTWVNDNKQLIGFTTVGGCLRFKRKDVEEYIESNYFKAKKIK